MSASLVVHLLGVPRVERDGVVAPPPRGRKAWALLAYLLATESTPSRQWLVDLLFSDAEDPLNALSWNLSQLRRLLGPGSIIGAATVSLRLPPGAYVDIRTLTGGTWLESLAIPGLGHELLEGMNFPSSASFEVWLLTARRRFLGAAEGVLREAARTKLAVGDTEGAIELAGRLVTANGLDEDSQEMLIRAYASAGDRASAERQRDACIALFQSVLGTEPGSSVIRAAEAGRTRERPPREPTRASIAARLEAAGAAQDAGASEAAIASLRMAVAEADGLGDAELQGRVLLAFGSALVHGVRGRDGEGAEILHQAIGLAERIGAHGLAARAQRELGYVETLRGRYERSEHWLRRATAQATNDPAEEAWAHAVQGIGLTDVGRYGEAMDELRSALQLGRALDDRAVQVWAGTFIGRCHLLRRELSAAHNALEEALRLARQLRWTSFIPLPEALLADVDLADGRIDSAAVGYEHAYELSLQLGDPCWEGIAARGIGLVADRRGDAGAAMTWVAQARTRCVRLPDAWLWVEAYCLDALCTLGVEHGAANTTRWISDLEALAARTGMREMVARAYQHRARLGDRAATEAARVLAAEVDNPALTMP